MNEIREVDLRYSRAADRLEKAGESLSDAASDRLGWIERGLGHMASAIVEFLAAAAEFLAWFLRPADKPRPEAKRGERGMT